MEKLPDEVVKQARELDLVGLIENHGVELSKRGADYFGLCPFHNEKSPSFTVNPGKGFYHCFGCGAHGGTVQFLMDFAGLGFRDAVLQLTGKEAQQIKPRAKREIEREEPQDWVPVVPVPETAMQPKDIIHRKINGKWVKLQAAARWEYRNAAGELIGYVYRFNLPEKTPGKNDGGKEVCPQVFARNNETGELEWRWLSFPKPRPIYGLELLAANPGAQVMVVEGEKACDAARKRFAAAGIGPTKLVVVSWPGGGKAVKHVDWAPLYIRRVGLWPDADSKPYPDKHPKAGVLMPFLEQPGNVAMLDIFKAIRGYCEGVKFFVPPPGAPDGWDLADPDPDGFDLMAHVKTSRLAETIETEFKVVEEGPLPWEGPDEIDRGPATESANKPAKTSAENTPKRSADAGSGGEAKSAKKPPTGDDDGDELPENNIHFTILGYDHERYFVFQHGKRQVAVLTKGDFTETGLIELAPLNWWELYFPGQNAAINKKAAANFIIRTAEKRGIFDMSSRSRGRGAWSDKGRFVYHHGDYLSVDGEKTDITQIKSKYVYELAHSLPEPANTPLSDEDGRRLLDTAKLFRWTTPGSAALLAGWVVLAPLCGALRWRPHIWLTGGAGCGKSTVLNLFVHVLMGGMDIFAQGNSSEAGIRQTLKADALPVLFDESESNEEGDARRIQNVLSLIRQASTESQAKTLKGTAGGDAMSFHIRSMFCLASVQVAIKHQADVERLTVLALRPKREDADAAATWKRIQESLYLIERDETLPARLFRRSIDLLPVIHENIAVFTEVAAARFGSQRDGDQYGTLLAGAWALTSAKPVTRAEAEAMIDSYDWSEHREHNETDEAQRALASLMEAHIRFVGTEYTVFELVREAVGEMGGIDIGIGMSKADAVLQRYGMRVKGDRLLLSNQSRELPRLMQGTPFEADLRGLLLRVPGADRFGNRSIRINGLASKCISLPIKVLLEEDVSNVPGDMEEF
jgi:hypothetical protein